MIETFILIANQVGISASLLMAVCQTETNLVNTVVMRDGGSASYGICQVKLNTARHLAKKIQMMRPSPSDLMIPEKNILFAALYLKTQIDRYHGHEKCGIGAYNKGHVDKCTGPKFSNQYVRKVKRKQSLLIASEYEGIN